MQPPLPPPPTSAPDVPPVSIGIVPNMPGLSSVSFLTIPPGFSGTVRSTNPLVAVGTTSNVGGAISFSTDESTEEEKEEEKQERSRAGVGGSGRKRKREQEQEGSKGQTRHMMEFFEGLMRQVLEKQEAMQQRFLEVIEKREQDRLVREEEWKRQETARLSGELELMAQERASSASRDAAIVSLLQKITGQTIQLPSISVTTSEPPPTQPQMQLMPVVRVSTQPPPSAPPPVTPSQIQQTPPLPQQHEQVHHHRHRSSISTEITMAIPEQEVAPSGSHEPSSSSRWPKEEVITLINVRSGLESRYREAGPKGPLWEEVSARMNQIGYKRSAKRCKEKWENINKYYKKVKESNKKRPEESKTCPYYHELDKLYAKKIFGIGTSSGGGFTTQNISPEQLPPLKQNKNLNPDPSSTGQERSNVLVTQQPIEGTESRQQDKIGGGNEESSQKPEDIIIMELMKKQGTEQQGHEKQSFLDAHESDTTNLDVEDDGEIDEEDDDDNGELKEQSEMGYKIEFQRQNTSNGGGNRATSSFLTMVQ